MNAGTPAAELSANPSTQGSGERPPVVVRADGAEEEELPARVRLVGGGPTNGVPGAYLDRIHELLHVFDGHDGQQWWLDAGTNELVTAVRKRTGLGPHPLLPG